MKANPTSLLNQLAALPGSVPLHVAIEVSPSVAAQLFKVAQARRETVADAVAWAIANSEPLLGWTEGDE